MSVLGGKGAAKAQVAAFGSQLRLMTQPIEDQSALRAAVQAIQPGDGHGNFGELARAVRAMAESVRTPIEFHRVQRHAAQRPGRHVLRYGAARQRQTGDACRGHQSAAQLDSGIGGRSRAGVGQGCQADPRAGGDRRLRHARGATHRFARGERKDHGDARPSRCRPTDEPRWNSLPLEVPYGFSRCEVKIDSRRRSFRPTMCAALRCSAPIRKRRCWSTITATAARRSTSAPRWPAAAQSAFMLESINVNEAGDRQPSNYAFVILVRSEFHAVAAGEFARRLRSRGRQCADRCRHVRRAAGRRFRFSARTLLRRATTRAFPIGSWLWARWTLLTRPSRRPMDGRA